MQTFERDRSERHPTKNNIFFTKKYFVYRKKFYSICFILFKTLVYSGKHSRNRMVLKFLDFDDWAAKNRLRSQSEKSPLHIMYYLATLFGRYSKDGLVAHATFTTKKRTFIYIQHKSIDLKNTIESDYIISFSSSTSSS